MATNYRDSVNSAIIVMLNVRAFSRVTAETHLRVRGPEELYSLEKLGTSKIIILNKTHAI